MVELFHKCAYLGILDSQLLVFYQEVLFIHLQFWHSFIAISW